MCVRYASQYLNRYECDFNLLRWLNRGNLEQLDSLTLIEAIALIRALCVVGLHEEELRVLFGVSAEALSHIVTNISFFSAAWNECLRETSQRGGSNRSFGCRMY